MRCLLLLLLSVGAWAQPALRELSPAVGRAGSKVTLNGSGFGTDPAMVKVLFGGVPAEVTGLEDTAITVKVPDTAPRNGPVRAEVNGASSGELPYLVLPSVRLTVLKNPLEAGETTTARFQVFQEDKPIELTFSNANPGIVQFSGGDSQTVKTSGGADNHYEFTVTGIVGNRLYTVNYQWGAQAVEFKEWKLGWNGVGWVEQGGEPPTHPGTTDGGSGGVATTPGPTVIPPHTYVKRPDLVKQNQKEAAADNARP